MTTTTGIEVTKDQAELLRPTGGGALEAARSYGVTIQAIDEVGARCATLEATTPKGYEEVRVAIGECRTMRTGVEATRKALKADALEWGRKVDAVAKDLTARLEAIEGPLKIKKAAVDEAKEKAKAEKERAEREEIERIVRAAREREEAEARAKREEEERELEAKRARLAEEQRLAEERRAAEEERLARERAELEAKLRAFEEQERAARERAEAEERARLERIEAEERAKREQAEAEERARVEKKRAAAEARRLAALRPDAEKLHAWAAVLDALEVPTVDTDEGIRARGRAVDGLNRIARELEAFGVKP